MKAKSFVEYVQYRRLHEMDEEPTGGLGDLAGPPEFGKDPMKSGTAQAKEALQDLQPSLAQAVEGPSGQKILSAMVAAVMSDPQVEDRIKNEIKTKVRSRWGSLIDLSGGDNEMGLNSGGAGSKNAAMGMDPAAGNNSVKPSVSDTGF